MGQCKDNLKWIYEILFEEAQQQWRCVGWCLSIWIFSEKNAESDSLEVGVI